ncbi:GGDEF domain-containing protein [Litoribacillus peritrichatus]|uniref:diguanylate cyclase n=1 Tax=Litoribacillus peritrichatus TaxID=718191 RepID=A0ABP7MJK1_9GAMM
MKYKEDVKKAAEILKKSIPELTASKVPITPYNYGIWYTHCSGVNKKLSTDLNNILKDYGTLNHEQSLDLFKRHVINDLLSIDDKLESNLQKVMSDMSESATFTEQNAGDLERELTISLRSLNSSVNEEELKTIISTISEKTRLVSSTTKQFKNVLSDAQQEINQLKQELQEAKEAANKDTLTKLFNRRHFDNKLATTLDKKRDSDAYALILLDVDHFKAFNDNYGHLMGDTVLKSIGQVLNFMCEDTNHIPYRYGGEEFAILMPKTSMREAKILAENTRKKISSLKIKDKKSGQEISKITASFGLAFFGPEDTKESLIERSDSALYRAKQNGRNQVVSQ